MKAAAKRRFVMGIKQVCSRRFMCFDLICSALLFLVFLSSSAPLFQTAVIAIVKWREINRREDYMIVAVDEL